MRRATAAAALTILAACGGSDATLDDAAITNRAAAISASANATVASQIAEIEQKAAEDVSAQQPDDVENLANQNGE